MRARHGATALALLLGLACAHVEPPSGGPEDETPPALVITRPDTLAVVPGWDAPATLVFNERVSERGLQDAVLVSPRTSAVVVDHRGDEIRVRLREGWAPNTIYHVTVLPGVLDLFSNAATAPQTLVFSTGPEIPDTEVAGVVRDPITGQVEAQVRVEALRTADSLVYAVPTDSAGAYRLARIPEGDYELRAFRDLNRNRALDPFEARAVTEVSVAAGDSLERPLAILAPDSTAPVVASAELVDSLTVELTFDDYLDPTMELAPAAVQIRSPGGSFVPISAVAVGDAEAPERRDRAAEADSAAGAAPLPSRTLRVTLSGDAEIETGVEYTVRVRNVRNLLGLEGDSETTLTATGDDDEPPVAPADTAAPGPAAPTDTARVAARPPPTRNTRTLDDNG